MEIYNKLLNKEAKLSVIGLGYVGMPIAISFAKHIDTIGYVYNPKKIELYKEGVDPTKEVGDDAIKETELEFTNDADKLKETSFIIGSVPTQINQDKTTDLMRKTSETRTIGKN